jgi:hypothetical protein
VGLAERPTSPYVHEGLLLVIALVLAGGSLITALLLRRRAPAVSIALSGAVVVGTVAFFVSAAHDRHGVPQDVGLWASVGLWVVGAVSVLLVGGRWPSKPLRRIALTCLVLAPFGAALLLLAVQQACPLYVAQGAGYCFYGEDVLGGWAAGVTVLFVLDMVAITAMLMIAGRAKKHATPEADDDAVVLY